MQAIINLWLLAHSTFTEGTRHKSLWAVVIMAVLLSMSNIGVAELFSWDLGKVSIEFSLSSVAFTGLLLVFFLGMKILADDLERHRVYMVMARPVTGWQYIFGKFFGLGLILLLATLILGVGAFVSMKYVLWRYPNFVPPNFSWSVFLMALYCQWLSLTIVLAINFFWFSFASQPFVAILFSAASYLVCQNMELLRRVTRESVYAGELHGKLTLFVTWLFPNLSFFDKKIVAAYGLPFQWSELFMLTAYCFSYIGILLICATLFFNRKELA